MTESIYYMLMYLQIDAWMTNSVDPDKYGNNSN